MVLTNTVLYKFIYNFSKAVVNILKKISPPLQKTHSGEKLKPERSAISKIVDLFCKEVHIYERWSQKLTYFNIFSCVYVLRVWIFIIWFKKFPLMNRLYYFLK